MLLSAFFPKKIQQQQQQQQFRDESFDFAPQMLTKIFSLWAKLMAICVVWQRTSISSGYLSEIP